MMPKAFLGCCKDDVGQHIQNADNASCFGSDSVRSNIFGPFLMTLQILFDQTGYQEIFVIDINKKKDRVQSSTRSSLQPNPTQQSGWQFAFAFSNVAILQ